jgi:hypothetical protein
MWIVPYLDEYEEIESDLLVRLVGSTVDAFTFECREKAFSHCVVIAVTNGAH